MKEMTKARLLKTRGIIKKACVWSPVAMLISGLGLGVGLLAGGGVKSEKGRAAFENSELFKQHYSQVYEDAKQKYDNGEIDINELNKTFNEINDFGYAFEAMEELGDEAKEYREMVKTGNQYMIGSIAGWLLLAGGLGTLIPWIGFEIYSDVRRSADYDFDSANKIIDKEKEKIEKEKKKQQEKMFIEEESDEEEELPDIQDSYYRD